MTIDEMIAVLQAAKQEKKILDFTNGHGIETNVRERLSIIDIRVAPEPREIWLPISRDGKTMDGFSSAEKCRAYWPGCEPTIFREVLEDDK